MSTSNSGLTAATTPLTGTEVMYVVQGGNSRKATTGNLYIPGGTDVAVADGGTGASTASAAFDALSPTTTRGDLIFRNATTNSRLAASTAGYLLQTNGAGTDPTYAGFLQTGTGAVTRTWQAKARDMISVKDFGAVGDGSTDDTTAIQAALDAVKAAGGGALYFPATSSFYKITSGLTYNLSAVASRFAQRIVIKGDGPNSCLSMVGVAASLLTITGSATYPEMHAHFEGIRLVGNNTVGSKGLVLSISAFGTSDGLIIEGFDYCMDCTDVEQTAFHNSNFRWGLHGMRFNAAAGTTSANSIVFDNCAIANNTTWGWQITNANAVTFIGGSTQYNGATAGGSTMWGGKVVEAGNGYGNVLFLGHIFEGNGGDSDYISEQSTYVSTHRFVGVGFARPNSTSYATNCIKIDGTTATTYSVSGCTMRGYNTYAASAGRPYFAVNNASALVFDDGTNVYGSATEQPAWAGADKMPVRLIVGVGGAALATAPFVVHNGTDGNIYVGSKVNLADGLVLGSVNDANTVFKGFEIRGSAIMLSGPTTVTGALTPTADDGGALGSTALKWSDLFLASGAVLNFNNGNYTVTHTAGNLSFNGAVDFTGAVLPTVSGTPSLGSTTKMWNSLFLKLAGVVNFNNGDYTITHSAGLLTYSGGVSFGGNLVPTTNDVGALGTSSLGFADLFLASGGVITFGGNDATITHGAGSRVLIGGNLGRAAPVTKTGNFSVGVLENWLICNQAATTTVTLPAAATWLGREIMIKTIQAQLVISASSNVVPLVGGSAGTAILAATAGKYATLVSNGTNWEIMAGN